MTKAKAIAESIAHWERMIVWAKKQISTKDRWYSSMRADIGETWIGDSCPLCKEFGSAEPQLCPQCPLQIKFTITKVNGCTPHWLEVHKSKTWGEWVTNAKVMLADLKSLEEK